MAHFFAGELGLALGQRGKFLDEYIGSLQIEQKSQIIGQGFFAGHTEQIERGLVDIHDLDPRRTLAQRLGMPGQIGPEVGHAFGPQPVDGAFGAGHILFPQ